MRTRWPGEFDAVALYAAMHAERARRGLTWTAVASQLTGIRTAKYAIGMTPAMRITQWLEEPASAFVYAASW